MIRDLIVLKAAWLSDEIVLPLVHLLLPTPVLLKDAGEFAHRFRVSSNLLKHSGSFPSWVWTRLCVELWFPLLTICLTF